MAGHEAIAPRIEHWEREKRNAIAQAHALNSGIGPGETEAERAQAADRLLDYAQTCRKIAHDERLNWARAILEEIDREVRANGSDQGKTATRVQALTRTLYNWIADLPSPSQG